jgi:lambda family phage portal protein
MANVIDRLVGWVDPAAGLRRHHQRKMLVRAYEAASPRDSWRPRRQGASANTDHAADAATIRAKARALAQNVPYVRAALDGLVAYTIGTGIISRATGAEAEAFNDAFARWQKVADADGRLDWPGIQAAAYRAMEQDGEVLIRLRSRRPDDNLPIPLQLQLLEVDWIDASRVGVIDGAQVVNGIEYDAIGRVSGYYLWDRHPGDLTLPRMSRPESRRVPASSILHLYAVERPGQGRGFSRLAPVIPRVRDLQLYEDAELARKNLESRLSVIASGDVSQMGDGPGPGEEPAAISGSLGELPGGGIVAVPAGLNLTPIEPKVAPGYVEYVRHQLHVIAAGIGVPYELATGDVSQTNYSSARVRILDFRRQVQSMQWLTIVPRLIEPVCMAAMRAAQLGGVIRRADARFDHSTPKWDYVNPEQDVKSDLAEIAGGLSSWSEKLRQRGYQPEQVLAEIRSDFQQLQQAGVLPILMSLQGLTAPSPDPGNPNS